MSILSTVCLLGGDETLGQHWQNLLCGRVPHQTAWSVYAGKAYNWSELDFVLVGVSQLYDYEDVWLHSAPEGLGVRLEGTLGAAGGTEFPSPRLITSAGFLAVYDFPESPTWATRFYAEAGVGLIYTDFQRPGQGLRLNFNPVAGIGWRRGRGFLTIRLHHISNGGLHHDNHGINSLLLGCGWYSDGRAFLKIGG